MILKKQENIGSIVTNQPNEQLHVYYYSGHTQHEIRSPFVITKLTDAYNARRHSGNKLDGVTYYEGEYNTLAEAKEALLTMCGDESGYYNVRSVHEELKVAVNGAYPDGSSEIQFDEELKKNLLDIMARYAEVGTRQYVEHCDTVVMIEGDRSFQKDIWFYSIDTLEALRSQYGVPSESEEMAFSDV
jgi:hypothetical protein